MTAPLRQRPCACPRNEDGNGRQRRPVVTLVGTSTHDMYCQPHVRVYLGKRAVEWEDPQQGTTVRIPVEETLAPGGKVTAREPIDPAWFDGMVQRDCPGGGAIKQGVALGRICRQHDVSIDIRVIDTGPGNKLVRERCAAEGIEVVFLHRHNLLVNPVVCFSRDKGVVRSRVVPRRVCLDPATRQTIDRMVAESDVVVCVSPKDAAVARQAWLAAREGGRFLQPTGSVEPLTERFLAALANSLAANAHEMFKLGSILGVKAPAVDEGAPCVPEKIAGVLIQLVDRDAIGCRMVAVTRGRHGSVTVDLERRLGFSIEIELSGNGVQTRNGAGDLWHAAWIFYRVLLGAGEPEASIKATQHVAERLGLPPSGYGLPVRDFRLPSTRAAGCK